MISRVHFLKHGFFNGLLRDHPCATVPAKFIYTDANSLNLFTAISMNEVRKTTSTWGYYLLLPFTFAADMATFPLQLAFFLWLLSQGSMC